MIDYNKALQAFIDYLKEYDVNNGMIALKVRHTYGVVSLSEYIAKDINLSKEDIELAKLIALLHDIGYNYVEANLRNVKKTIDSEYRDIEIKKHVIYGYSILENEGWISEDSKDIILSHHQIISFL